MTTMRNDAWKKVLNGVTTVEEVNRVTQLDEPLYRTIATAADAAPAMTA